MTLLGVTKYTYEVLLGNVTYLGILIIGRRPGFPMLGGQMALEVRPGAVIPYLILGAWPYAAYTVLYASRLWLASW